MLITLLPREKLVGSIPTTLVQSPAFTTTILLLESHFPWNEGVVNWIKWFPKQIQGLSGQFSEPMDH